MCDKCKRKLDNCYGVEVRYKPQVKNSKLTSKSAYKEYELCVECVNKVKEMLDDFISEDYKIIGVRS